MPQYEWLTGHLGSVDFPSWKIMFRLLTVVQKSYFVKALGLFSNLLICLSVCWYCLDESSPVIEGWSETVTISRGL